MFFTFTIYISNKIRIFLLLPLHLLKTQIFLLFWIFLLEILPFLINKILYSFSINT